MRIPLVSWLTFIFCYCICLGIDISLVSGQCLKDQRSLLIKLKNDFILNTDNSSKLLSWNQSPDCCSWHGVTCDERGRVTGLDLSQQNISSKISSSSSLFGLQYLQHLNLAYNSFISEIPSGFHNLTNLSYLNLSNAGFVGQIPFEISQLTRLVILDLSTLYYLEKSTLKLENPNLAKLLRSLTEVRELYLDGVNISLNGNDWGHALSSSLPNLQVLSMSSCNLRGPFDSSLETLKNLSIISLSQNNLSAAVPEFFAKFSNLTTLQLSSCGLSGRFPEEILQVQTLSSLDISYNFGFYGSLPNFTQSGSLQRLILSYTNFSGVLPGSIGNLRQLSRLELSTCQFNGVFPYSMANLTELTYLDLSSNNFTGPIPPFGTAKKLTHIDLSHNALTGTVPSAHLDGLVNLVIIDLRYNFLNGSIPSSLFGLPLLKSVMLSNNHFNGQLVGFSNISSTMLETIDLSNNDLDGVIPESIFNFSGLNILQLSSNNFSGLVQLHMIWRLKNLTALDLSHNNLSINTNLNRVNLSSFPNMTSLKLVSCKLREIPEFLKNQSRLNSLDLSNNQIQGAIPNWIWQLDSLAQLNLSHNKLMNLQGPLQSHSANLIVLDLHSNILQGALPPFPKHAIYLDYSQNKFTSISVPSNNDVYFSTTVFLFLSHNNIYGNIPMLFCKASNLEVLDLSYNQFGGTIPWCLTESETLGVLNLRSNNLSGNIPDNFPLSCALQTLDLHGNLLGGQIPKSLANCTTLEVLDLGHNQIVDGFPCLLKNITKLRVLILRENKFQGSIGCPNTTGTWNMLQIVDLAFNKFNGILPRKCFTTWEAMMPDEAQAKSKLNHLRFGVLLYGQVYYQDRVTVTSKGLEMNLVKILTVFTAIDFSFNHFEGPIPEEMMDFKALYVLNLSNNALTGQIPSSIVNLKQLESLDLSNNSLSGEIPTNLASLSFLSFLNLSHNLLVGKIPTGTQLQSFAESSFIGNKGLCGAPLTTNCPDSGDRSSPEAQYTDAGAEFDWQFVSTGVGFGVGAGLVVAPLMMWEKGRKWSNTSIDKILLVILPMVGLTYTPIDDDDEEEEDTEELNTDMANDCDNSEDEDKLDYLKFRGRYCVFCSKLDISRKRVIHDPSCTCHHSPPVSTSNSSSESFSP